MNSLKFRAELVSLVLSGKKTITWRLFDEKDLQPGDVVTFVNAETGGSFATAEIISVREKLMSAVNAGDFSEGHEPYATQSEMLETFRGYYGDAVTLESILKIVDFRLR